MSRVRVPGVGKAAFRERLVAACGGCAIQHTGWPCGSCFGASELGDEEGEDWRAVLAYRGDYDDAVTGDAIRMAVGLVFDDDGRFVRHEFRDVPLAEVRARIVALAAELGKMTPWGGIRRATSAGSGRR